MIFEKTGCNIATVSLSSFPELLGCLPRSPGNEDAVSPAVEVKFLWQNNI
jgi:hypothetical protein